MKVNLAWILMHTFLYGNTNGISNLSFYFSVCFVIILCLTRTELTPGFLAISMYYIEKQHEQHPYLVSC